MGVIVPSPINNLSTTAIDEHSSGCDDSVQQAADRW